MKRIGIYGGTFDPIHNGHLILGREAREQLGLDKIIFVPAAVSPFKNTPATPAGARWSMVQAAIQGEPFFAADDCELHRPAPSYAIDTARDIHQREGGPEIYYLIGQDNVASLGKWHKFEELNKLVKFAVLDRAGSEDPHGYPVIRRKIDISATEIRNRVASRRSIRYLVPGAVEEIIRQGNLYREAAR